MIRSTVGVHPGEFVRQAQPIGLCGHSGHSSEPHLHFHLQDSPDLLSGMGLPIPFSNVIIDQRERSCDYVTAGQRVRNASDKIDGIAPYQLPNNTQAKNAFGSDGSLARYVREE
jgi:murein DD-endopeptidase MepM/ murein hydrolase activator NlpD